MQWEEVAIRFNGGRSALQCLSRFRHLQSRDSREPWSDDENKQLQASYLKHAKKPNLWQVLILA